MLVDTIKPELYDAPPVPPHAMGDDEFWALISVLNGTPTGEGMAALEDSLSALSFDELFAFEHAFRLKLRALDDPGNTAQVDGVVSKDASLYYRCEIVAAGRETFDERVAHPTLAGPDDGRDGEVLLGVARDIAGEDFPAGLPEFETGKNAHLLVRPQLERCPPGLWPGPFSYELQIARLGIGPHIPMSFWVFVAYASDNVRVREITGILESPSIHGQDARTDAESYVQSLIRSGEELNPHVRVFAPEIGGVQMSIPLFSRTFRGTTDDYIGRFHLG